MVTDSLKKAERAGRMVSLAKKELDEANEALQKEREALEQRYQDVTLTNEQAGAFLGVTRMTIYRMLKDGRLKDTELKTLINYKRDT